MEYFYYKVKSGESVLQLTQKFSTPLSYLIGANGLKKEVEKGDILIIPKNNAANKIYGVDVGLFADGAVKFSKSEYERACEKTHLPYLFYGLPFEL